MIRWREELKETQPEQNRALNCVDNLMRRASHFALLVATLVSFFIALFFIQFSILLLT